MKKVILFDLDGTLIDSTEAIIVSFIASYEKFNIKHPKSEDILTQIGHPLYDMFVNLGIDKNEANKFVLEYKKNYRQIHTKKTKLINGAKDAVELAYNSGAKLGIVTTKTGKYSIELMEYFGLMKYFDTLIGSEDVKKHKPNPEPIYKALKNLNVTDSSNVYMIGDTCMDMLAANSAGILGVGVEFKYTPIDKLKECSKVIYSGVFEAVSNILDNKI